MTTEDRWIDALRKTVPPSSLPGGVGIGDDAALLHLSGEDVVLAKDVLVDGRHFDVATCGLAAALYKAVAVNLSDLAAVAARPVGFLLGVVTPHADDDTMRELRDAIEGVVTALAVPCIGGDTNVGRGPWVLSVTAVGVPGPGGFVSRDGARPGDVLSVTGPLGGSRAGRHLQPPLRGAQALVLAGFRVPRAMIDLSDGLGLDLPRLARASGVGFVVQGERVPIHDDVPAGDARERLARALHDGEDFELLLAHAPVNEQTQRRLTDAGVSLHAIGHCTEKAQGCALQWAGRSEDFPVGGFDHLAS